MNESGQYTAASLNLTDDQSGILISVFSGNLTGIYQAREKYGVLIPDRPNAADTSFSLSLLGHKDTESSESIRSAILNKSVKKIGEISGGRFVYHGAHWSNLFISGIQEATDPLLNDVSIISQEEYESLKVINTGETLILP